MVRSGSPGFCRASYVWQGALIFLECCPVIVWAVTVVIVVIIVHVVMVVFVILIVLAVVVLFFLVAMFCPCCRHSSKHLGTEEVAAELPTTLAAVPAALALQLNSRPLAAE